jgi:hypothetical protein
VISQSPGSPYVQVIVWWATVGAADGDAVGDADEDGRVLGVAADGSLPSPDGTTEGEAVDALQAVSATAIRAVVMMRRR